MNRRYLLDTNILSDLAKRPAGPVTQRITEQGVESIATSLVVACEIRFGLAKSGSPLLAENMNQVLDSIEIMPLEHPVDEHYAEIRNALECPGAPIGPNDLLIAAHARALGMILVTDNVRKLSRVRGLQMENSACIKMQKDSRGRVGAACANNHWLRLIARHQTHCLFSCGVDAPLQLAPPIDRYPVCCQPRSQGYKAHGPEYRR